MQGCILPKPRVHLYITVMNTSQHTKKPSLWLRIILPLVLVFVWLGVSGIGGPYFGKISEVASNDLSTFLPENAEATKVTKQLEAFRGTSSIPAIIVFENTNTVADSTEQLTAIQKKLQGLHGVNGTLSPAIASDDTKAALLVVPLHRDEKLKTVFTNMREAIDSTNSGLSYKIGGPAAFAQDLQKAFSGIDGTLLIVALSVVFIILLIVYRSPFLPLIVLVAALAALSGAIATVWWLANAGLVQLNGQVQGILFILVIGAATDYSLLYLARLREELFNNKSNVGATKAALKGSYESIIAAGGTVIVGLMCLLLSDLGSNKALGPVGGIGILFAVASALTFLPAMLLLCGRKVFWPKQPVYDPAHMSTYGSRHRLWAWVGNLVRQRPRRIWISLTALLIIACAGVFQLKADGVAQNELVLGYSEAREAQQAIDRHFPGGSGSPAYILIKEAAYHQAVSQLDNDRGVASVAVTANNSPSGSLPLGSTQATIKAAILAKVTALRDAQLQSLRSTINQRMAGAPAVAIEQAYQAAASAVPSAAQVAEKAYPFKNATPKAINGTVLLEATLAHPADSQAARQTIERLRQTLKQSEPSTIIGGATAVQADTNSAGIHDRTIIIPVVLLAITIILGILLRSLIAPIILLLTTVLSFGATLGISAFLFNNVWHFPGSDPSVILYAFVFLVALGIDYNIFLMTRVREETLKSSIHTGTIKALVVTGGVITSAGIVLAATFAALGVIPILFLAQIAFVVAFGVLLDTIIVRSLLVPALVLQLGDSIWWPLRRKQQKPNK